MNRRILDSYIESFKPYLVEESGEFGFEYGRVHKNEGYKREIVKECRKILESVDWDNNQSVCNSVIKVLNQSNNIIRWDVKLKTVEYIKSNNIFCADAFKTFFCLGDDKDAFELISGLFGRRYRLVSYFMFVRSGLIDLEIKCVPIAPEQFEENFSLIGCNEKFSNKCSWDNYSSFLNLLSGIRKILDEKLDCQVDLLDAHSFAWMIKSIRQEAERDDYNSDKDYLEEIEKDIQNQSLSYQIGKREKTEDHVNGSTSIPKRDARVATNALAQANYLCEVDNNHPTFLRKTKNYNYTEPHHLIPLSQRNNFDYSLDCEANIVSLCSNCHNQLHYGRYKKEMLTKLYNERKEALQESGIETSLEDLLLMYDAKE